MFVTQEEWVAAGRTFPKPAVQRVGAALSGFGFGCGGFQTSGLFCLTCLGGNPHLNQLLSKNNDKYSGYSLAKQTAIKSMDIDCIAVVCVPSNVES